MVHHTSARSLLGFVRSFSKLDLSDPLTQCLAPGLARNYATQTDLPSQAKSTPTRNRINPNVDPRLYAPARVLTTLHSWPALEPVSQTWYKAQQLDVPLRRDLLHRAVIFEADSTRQGTASTKWRSEVAGSNRKIQPQKGLGRARAGDKKSPIRKGGGVAFGPKPRDFSTDLQRKVYDRAWRIALSYRYRKGELVVLQDPITMSSEQTPQFFANFFGINQWGAGHGRSLLVANTVGGRLKKAMQQVGEHGLLRDVFDVDVKDLLETGRIVIEKRALDELLWAHSSDLGIECTLQRAKERLQPRRRSVTSDISTQELESSEL